MKSFDSKSAIIGVLSCALVLSFFSSTPTYPEHIVCKSLTVQDDSKTSLISMTSELGGPRMKLADVTTGNQVFLSATSSGSEVVLVDDHKIEVDLSTVNGPRLNIYVDHDLRAVCGVNSDKSGTLLLMHENGETACYMGKISPRVGGWVTYDSQGDQVSQSRLQ